VEVEQDEAPLVFGGGEENIVELARGRRIQDAWPRSEAAISGKSLTRY
jgi:hypothetical protein